MNFLTKMTEDTSTERFIHRVYIYLTSSSSKEIQDWYAGINRIGFFSSPYFCEPRCVTFKSQKRLDPHNRIQRFIKSHDLVS